MPSQGVKANPAIRPLGPVTPADVDAIRDCFRRGLGVADTARELGLSTGQVSDAKGKHGLTAEFKATQGQIAATEAFSLKARRQRHERRDRIIAINQKILDDLESDLRSGQVVTILRGVQGIESEVIVEKIPARDLRERLAAWNLTEAQIQKLDALEDDQGLARGLSMLETFTEAAGRIAGALGTPREGLIQE